MLFYYLKSLNTVEVVIFAGNLFSLYSRVNKKREIKFSPIFVQKRITLPICVSFKDVAILALMINITVCIVDGLGGEGGGGVSC